MALCGLGAVGRAFLELWIRSRARVLREERLDLKFTGVATRTRGAHAHRSGIGARELLRPQWRRSTEPIREMIPGAGERTLGWVRHVPADVLVESTPLSPRSGQPALTYVETALSRGLHVVTANKGPIAWGWRRLQRAATRSRVHLYVVGTVMDGAPILTLRHEALASCRVRSFRGVVNSTTQFVLQEVETGCTLPDALAHMQRRGIAEADPRHDLEGWDAALKTAVLANAFLGGGLRPDRVRRQGILRLSEDEIRRAATQGRPWRLVAEGGRDGRRVWGRVGPQRLRPEDPLAHLCGTSNALTLNLDPLGAITLVEIEPDVRQTACALLMDLVRLSRAVRGAA